MKNLFPILLIVGSVHAQGVADTEAATKASEPAPPKAQVIEEEVDITVDDAKVAPAGVVASDEAKKSPEKSAVEANAKDRKELKPQFVKPVAEMPPLSELRPLIPEPKKRVNEGIQIQVEKVKGASSHAGATGKVKVSSPWPAKPLDSPPLGWKYIPAPDGIDPYRTAVKLGDQKSVNLSITPYVLVPASDGRNVIRIVEPGYQPAQGYLQEDTIGSILKESTQELERHEQRAAAAIQRFQQLLSSLPQS